MAKFDLFDKSTWVDTSISIQEKVKNKALGWIGGHMGDIRQLRKAIIGKNAFTEAYHIAEDLRSSNPEAYKLMEVSVVYSDTRVNDVIQRIDRVLAFWADTNNRSNNWEQISDLLQPLQEFFCKHSHRYSFSLNERLDKLVQVEVNGNEAWKAYLGQAHCHKFYQEKEKKEKLDRGRFNPPDDYDD